MDDDWSEDKDVERILSILKENGIEVTKPWITKLWKDYSETYCAGWLVLEEDDDDLFLGILYYLESKTKMKIRDRTFYIIKFYKTVGGMEMYFKREKNEMYILTNGVQWLDCPNKLFDWQETIEVTEDQMNDYFKYLQQFQGK